MNYKTSITALILFQVTAVAEASPVRGIAGGLLAVERSSGEFRKVSPLTSAKADLFEESVGKYSLEVRSGKSEFRFDLGAPRAGKNKVRVFEGHSPEGLKVTLRDNTTCEYEACRGPLWRAEITRAGVKGETLAELVLTGDVTVYPDLPIQPAAELAGKVGRQALAASTAPTGGSAVSPALPPADIGSLAPEIN